MIRALAAVHPKRVRVSDAGWRLYAEEGRHFRCNTWFARTARPEYPFFLKEANVSDPRYPNESREYRDARDALLQDERELVEKV